MSFHREVEVDQLRRKMVLAAAAGISLWSSKMFGGSDVDPFAYTWPNNIPPFKDATGRTAASATINADQRTFVALIEGQSLAGAHIPHAYTVLHPTKIRCVNWAGDRLLYEHKEPMMGGSYYEGAHVSLWGKLGDLLISRGTFDRIIWANTSVAGASSADLAPDGVLGHRIPVFFNALRSLGISGDQVSAIISMEGERDAGTLVSGAAFKENRRQTRRTASSYGFTGPMFIPMETFNGMLNGTSLTIRQAQAELATEVGFAPGPDFDSLGPEYRDATKVHLNGPLGHDTAAQMWADCIGARFASALSGAPP